MNKELQRGPLPHVTVAAIVERDGKFLMVEEVIKGELLLNQPAGHVECGENIVEACRREVLEETGWVVNPQSVVGVDCYNAANGISYVRFTLHAEAVMQQSNGPLDKDIHAAVWMTRHELQSCEHRHRSPLVGKVVMDFLSGYCFPLSLFASER